MGNQLQGKRNLSFFKVDFFGFDSLFIQDVWYDNKATDILKPICIAYFLFVLVAPIPETCNYFFQSRHIEHQEMVLIHPDVAVEFEYNAWKEFYWNRGQLPDQKYLNSKGWLSAKSTFKKNIEISIGLT